MPAITDTLAQSTFWPASSRCGQIEKLAHRIAAAFLACVALIAAINLSPLMGSWTVRTLFDLNGEATVAAWLSSAALLAIAFVACTIAVIEHGRACPGSSRQWLAIAALFCALSLDEAAQLHEILGSTFSERVLRGPFREGVYMWVPLLLPVAIFVAHRLFRWFTTGARRHHRESRWAIAALAVWPFVLVFELWAGFAGDLPVLVVVEEGLEFVGHALMFIAVAAAADRTMGSA